jgi:hypothetical protein
MQFKIRSIIDLLRLPILDFVQASYWMLLGRMPDPSELNTRASLLRSGWGRRRLLADISRSPEFKVREDQAIHEGDEEAFITQLYGTYLHRKPDPNGLATYMDFLRKGKSRADIRKQIATSREARNVGSFWCELEFFMADERTESRRLIRWFGHSKRLNRRRNQEFEIEYSEHKIHRGLLSGREAEAVGASLELSANGGALVTTSASLQFVESADMGPNARRALSRLQHSAKNTSASKGVS